MVPDAVLSAFVEAKGVREATREIAKVQESLREAKRDADQATAAVNRFGRVRGIAVLDVDAAKAKAQTAQAQKSLNGFDGTKATADLRADAAQVQKATGTATRDIAKFDALKSTAKLDVDASKLGAVNGEVRKSRGAFVGLTRQIEDTGERGSRALGGLRTAAGLLGGVAIGAGLARGFRAATDEFEEARKVGALTEQVIKSTGGAANITAREVQALAGAISKKVGIDDEAIQSASNLLLTFKNVRNETGKGRDIFNQATKAAVDLSAAGFGSLDSTSKQLGKALNDPVKGMTALGRAGVTFSEDQKQAIEALIKTGRESDRLRAQQIILREVQSQVGGAAAAQATPLDKLRVTMGNLAEVAGATLVPMLDKGARFLTKLLDGMMNSRGAGGAIVDVFKAVGSAIGGTVVTIRDIVNWFREHKTVTMALAGAVAVLATAFVATLIPGFVIATAVIYSNVAAWVALKVAMLSNPIGLVVVAIAALVAGLIVAYRESETFRNIVDGAFKAVAAAFGVMWDAAKAVFGWLASNWGAVAAILTSPIQTAITIITNFGPMIFGAARGLLSKFTEGATSMFAAVKGVGGWIVAQVVAGVKAIVGFAADVGGWLKNRVVEGVHAYAEGLKGLGGWVLNRIVEGFKVVGEALASVGGWLKNRVVEVVQLAVEGFTGLGGWILNRIVEGFRTVTEALSGVGGWLKNRVGEALTAAKDGFLGFGSSIMDWIVDGLKGGANLLVKFVNTIIDVINKIPGVDIKPIKELAQGGVNGGGGRGGPNGTGTLARQAFAHGGAFARTGGIVSSPITLMGEEAPLHREWVIPENPAYRGRALGLWQQAGAQIGAFAQGGSYSVGDMAKLASAVDAPNPRLMGAIGMAESGGNPHAVGPPTSGGRARGLWQIMWPLHQPSFPGMDPFRAGDNARMMRSILASQGLGAWEAYSKGMHKQYMNGGGGGGGGGGLGAAVTGFLGSLLSNGPGEILDKLPGVGDLPDWLKGTGKYVLGKAGDWIKDKVKGLVGAGGGGGGASGKPGGGGAGTFDGRPVANWIIPILNWARRNGWGGSITSGVRTEAQNAAAGGAQNSNHLRTAYPGGAVDVGGWGARAEGQALASVLAGYEGPRKLVWAGPTIGDWGHFSATGNKMGGVYGGSPLLGSFAAGTDYVPQTGPYMLHRGESVTPAGVNNDALIASLDRHTAELRDLKMRGVAVVTLTDQVGTELGDRAVRRGATGGDPNVTHRLY